MKRIQEKVKDLVEVRPYSSVRDFVADPAETLSNYHFTDATSDLMAKWLDRIAAVQSGSGAALALAGYRGVGKSHFLATLGALASNPELRTRVSESHVSFSAQRLQRRHYPVAYLRRGTHETLRDEFNAAISSVFEIVNSTVDLSYSEVLTEVVAKSSDTPFILMIDTAFERGSRVSRDDGGDLSEIADAAKQLNIFVGVALDDDIAGADGSNSGIASSFSIDYLDQAHLYKVVDTHIFPKHAQMQPVLHDIYHYFREVLPSFRWSEQKFATLYPLHPAILEVAPYVRLYVHEFALLGFASEAGEKILGRPANSLIALDEVYDNAENGLRKVQELAEAFAAYDALNSTVVGKIPVMQRLQAKLILKALLLLSLDGQGGTAEEICASVMIFDESDPEKALKTVDDLLTAFIEAMPDDFSVANTETQGKRYSFKVSSKENLNHALMEAAKNVPANVLPGIIRRVFQERFHESGSQSGLNETNKECREAQIVWRGGIRRGLVSWQSPEVFVTPDRSDGELDSNDWQVIIDLQNDHKPLPADSSDMARVIWKPDQLRPAEIEKLRSYFVVSADRELREKYGEQIRASVHAHSIAAEKILNRSFLDDGKLVIDGFDYNFTDEARAAQSLSALFGAMLEPLFETRYPSHPYFTQTLEHADVAAIVTDLYNGTRKDLADVQGRAQNFAFPLGLVRLEGSLFVPEISETLVSLPIVADVLDLVETGGDKSVSLSEVFSHLRKGPNGLVLEAQQMVLTAMVAQRLIEFVTSSGNRINRRSLDLKIIWEDIVAVARPIENSFSGERLNRWAALFVKDRGFQSLDRPQDREALRTAFAEWTRNWKELRVLERFAMLPDGVLNVRTWNLAARVTKTFGSVAHKIQATAEGTMELEECLDGIADAFSEAEPEMRACENDLAVLTSFVKGAGLRDEVQSYLAVCEATQQPGIENIRERVVGLADTAYAEPSDAVNRELSHEWEKFKREYSEYFDACHASAMNSTVQRTALYEILGSDRWHEFEMLSDLPYFDSKFVKEAVHYRQRITELECRINPRDILQSQPFCVCAFSFDKLDFAAELVQTLNNTVSEGLSYYRAILLSKRNSLTDRLTVMSKGADSDLAHAATELLTWLSSGGDIPSFSELQLKIFREMLTNGNHFMEKPASAEPVGDSLPSSQNSNESLQDLAEEFSDDGIAIKI